MKEQLIKISELGEMLDYSDLRSTESWCKKNNIPIVTAGKQKYVLPYFINRFIKDSLSKFLSVYYPESSGIINDIEKNDSINFSEFLKPKINFEQTNKLNKVQHGKVAQDFLNNIK